MLIIPAIDLKNKKCVRLWQGQFDKETIFNDDPIKVARDFTKSGAKWLHIIDLDGAQSGQPQNLDIVSQIKNQLSIKVQFGGGIRSKKIFNKLNIDKYILGTSAIDNTNLLEKINNKKNIIISIDAKNGKVMINGWQKNSNASVFDIINYLKNKKFNNFIYTDVERDGTLQGPNLPEIKILREEFPDIDLTIAGGISKIEDIKKLNQLKINKIIIGKALYTNPKLKKYVSQKNYSLS